MAEPEAGPVPSDALEYFRAKELRVGFDYRDVWREEHAVQFTVAKMTQADVLATMEQSLDQALEQGHTFESWRQNVRPELEKAGWWGKREVTDPETGRVTEVDFSSPRRLKTIYDTNMRTAYSAGQWQRIQRTKRGLPYLLYTVGPSREHRPEHLDWNGTLLSVDDEWWDTHMPQNGYGCKCRVRQISKREYEQIKQKGIPSPGRPEFDGDGLPTGRLIRKPIPAQMERPAIRRREWINQRTGEVMQVPVGIDPGFDTNPGRTARLEQVSRQFAQKLPRLPAGIGAETYQQVETFVTAPIGRDFRDWARPRLESGRSDDSVRVIAGLRPEWIRALADRDLVPNSAAVAISANDLVRLNPPMDLPRLVGRPDAVLDAGGSRLILVSRSGNRAEPLTIEIQLRTEGAETVQRIRDIRRTPVAELQGFTVIQGEL